jgi:hypothetical protein
LKRSASSQAERKVNGKSKNSSPNLDEEERLSTELKKKGSKSKVMEKGKVNIYESPIFSVEVNNAVLHLVMDIGATANLISERMCKELDIPVFSTRQKAIQANGTELEITGEIHMVVTRDKLKLKFNALVIKKMATEALAGKGFHEENNIYTRVSTGNIIIKGIHIYITKSSIVLTASIQEKRFDLKDTIDTTIPDHINTPCFEPRDKKYAEQTSSNNKFKDEMGKVANKSKEVRSTKIKIDPKNQLIATSENELAQSSKDLTSVADFTFRNPIEGNVDSDSSCAVKLVDAYRIQKETKAESPRIHYNAVLLARNKQKILLLRDNLTSYTLTKILRSKLKEDLRESLIELASFLRICRRTTTRVNPHPCFQAWKQDKTLNDYGIELEIGKEKSINKNVAAEKAIQELKEEPVKTSPGNNPVIV